MSNLIRNNLTELSNLFDTILSKAAVEQYDVTEYVKSIYLTKAQFAFVESVIQLHESSEYVRQILKGIIHSVGYEGAQLIDSGPNSFFTPYRKGVKAILFEEITTDTQLKVPVIPLNENDRNLTVKNPFRKPNNKIAYRITEDNAFKILHSDFKVAKYEIVYCDEPAPIVLTDLPDELSIDSVSVESLSSLSMESLYKIVDLAVDLYLQNKAKLAPNPQPQGKAQ